MRATIAIAAALLLAARAAVAADDCASANCHASILKHKNVHPPAEACDTCHETVTTPHPQKGKKTFKLVSEPPELCTTCHDAVGTKSDVHPPVKDGMCTTCHDPHASDEAKLLVQPLKELCTTCHSDIADRPRMHGPAAVGACTACHDPHQSDVKPLLVKKAEDLCAGCHADFAAGLKKAHVHPALDAGCTTCHDPHGSKHAKLLSDEGNAVCFPCHGDIEEKVTSAAVVHAAVKGDKGCAGCHTPHASDNAKLLLLPQRDTCLACHQSVVPPNAADVHAPVKDGTCTACHDPHGAANPALLVASFPKGFYVPYTDAAYGLCFSCHKRELLQYPDTSYATGFRDGERNLHYLHVHDAQKGRSCRLCHEMHASTSPKLIADAVPFGSWRLPLKFVKTETGGSCAPGCHKPQSYDRKKKS